MTSRIYFIITEPGMTPHTKRPPADPIDFARELIAHYPAGTAILYVDVRENDLWVETAEQRIAMDKAYAAAAEASREIAAANDALLNKIEIDYGDVYAENIRACLLECEAPAEYSRLEIVDKPHGRPQDEDWKSFKKIYVRQQSVGTEGDSFEGEIYIPLPGGKFLKAPFSI